MGLGGRLFMKYQYGPDGPEQPPPDPWRSRKLTVALVVVLVTLGGLIWLGIAQPGVARVIRWGLMGVLGVTSLPVLLTKPRLFFEVFSARVRVHSLLTGSALGEQDSLNEILMQLVMAMALLGTGALSWVLRAAH